MHKLKWSIVFISVLFCLNLFGQKPACIINDSYENTPLPEVLAKLERQCNVKFAYDTKAISKIKITQKIAKLELTEALSIILKGNNLQFKIISETVAIFPGNTNDVVETDTIWKTNDQDLYRTIKGEVRSDESKELLPFSNIQLLNGTIGTVADLDGKFSLRWLPQTADTIEISYIGHEPFRMAVSKINSDNYKTYYLQELKNYLPSVLIETERIRLLRLGPMASTILINPNDLALSQGTGEADIMRAAQLMAGVSATQESSNGLFVRGSSSDQTQVTMDGFTLYHLDHFFGAFAAINTNAVKSMQLIKGTMDASYGGRTAGILEVIGKEGNLKRTSAKLDIGGLSVGGVIETPLDKNGKAGLIITGRRAYTDAFYSPTYKGLFNNIYNSAITLAPGQTVQTFRKTESPDYYFQDANFKITYRPSQKSVLSLSAYAGKDHLYIAYADTSNSEVINLEDKKYNDESTWKNAGLGLRWGQKWSPSTSSNLLVGWSSYKTDFFTRDSTFNPIANSFERSEFKTERTSLYDLNLKASVQKKYKAHTFTTGIHTNVISTSHGLGQNTVVSGYYKQQGNISAIFVQDNWNLGKHWQLMPGARLNYFNLFGTFYPEHRLAATRISSNKVWQMKFSVGRNHQFIQRIRSKSLYLNTPDYWKLSDKKILPVIISDQATIGATYRKKNWTIDAEAYLKLTQGNTTFLGVYSGYSESYPIDSLTGNGLISGNGHAEGLDLMVQYDAGKHHAWLSYSLLNAQTKYNGLDVPLVHESFEQHHEIKTYYEFAGKRWEYSLLWVFGSGKPYTPFQGTYNYPLLNGDFRTVPVYGNINSARLPAYHRLDLGVSYNFTLQNIKGNIQFSCFNIYNRKNIRNRQYLIVRNGNEPNDYLVAERDIYMLGFLPSLILHLSF